MTKSHDASKHDKATYQYLLEKASILVRLAQSDPTTMTSLCTVLEQLTSQLRNSESIVIQSYDMSLPFGKENPGAAPVLGTLKMAPNVYHQKRKKSSLESRRQIIHRASNPSLSVVRPSNNLAILAEPRARGKLAQFAGVVDINVSRALESISSESHHWT
jgi:hypothetical protein